MVQMFDNPAFVHRVARMVTVYSLEQLDMLIDAGLDVLVVEDDIADRHSPLISPAKYREFIKPYNMELVEKAHLKGLKAVTHSDGTSGPCSISYSKPATTGSIRSNPRQAWSSKR